MVTPPEDASQVQPRPGAADAIQVGLRRLFYAHYKLHIIRYAFLGT